MRQIREVYITTTMSPEEKVMNSNILKFPHLPSEFYSHDLLKIRGLKFTPRQIDIMACLISGKTTKEISARLSVAEKTIEAHKSAIYKTIGCHHQQSVINFIENSNKFEVLKRHYAVLLHKNHIEKELIKLFPTLSQRKVTCLIEKVNDGIIQKDHTNSIINLLSAHLRLGGINIISDQKNNILNSKSVLEQYSLSFISKKNLSQLQDLNKIENNEDGIFFITNQEAPQGAVEKVTSLNLDDPEQYFYCLIKLIKEFYPQWSFDESNLNTNNSHPTLTENQINNSSLSFLKALLLKFFIIRRIFFAGVSLGLIVLGGVLLNDNKFNLFGNSKVDEPIRSDLPLPANHALLKRSNLTNQITRKLKEQKDIQTVALVGVVGMGGVGKTTLARQFGYSQKASTVWELNAETKESLINSFKDLAYALARTKEKKDELNFIQNIQNSDEREKQLISFVKYNLKQRGDWFLIYDNVEKLSAIRDYFPQDPQVWGHGKVIITSRDSNIRNTSYIKPENVIHIEELDKLEALTLFSRILFDCEYSKLSPEQKQNALNFLQRISPFPLDISAAAYYIKSTNITYEDYIERINNYRDDFAADHEKIIKEMGHYHNSRYGIIGSSIEKIIDTRPEFKELLLFICLLDSQNIPNELLENYKEKTIVAQFIYTLRTYSLITNFSIKNSLSTYFSIHRSIQDIILIYLENNFKLEKCKKLSANIAKSFNDYLDSIITKEDFAKMRLITTHCEKFLSHNDLLDDEAKGFLSNNLGDIYCYLSDNKKAKLLFEGIYHRLKDKNNPSIGDILFNLGNVYREEGNYEKSIKALKEAFLIFKHRFHKTHYQHALTLGALGRVYGSAGDYEKAKSLLEESLLISKSNFNEKPLIVAWILARLGNIYKELGDYSKAISTLEKSFSIFKKYFSLDHVRIAWIQAYLGDAYRLDGNYKNAKILLEQSFITSKKHLSEAHGQTAWISTYLGNLYKDLGEYEKAKELFKKSLVIYRQHYPRDHHEIAELLNDIGHLYLLDNKLLSAEDYCNKSLSIFEANQHPRIYLVYEILAKLYMQKSTQVKLRGHIQKSQSFEKKAQMYLENALKIATSNFPKSSLHITRIQEKLKSLNSKLI